MISDQHHRQTATAGSNITNRQQLQAATSQTDSNCTNFTNRQLQAATSQIDNFKDRQQLHIQTATAATSQTDSNFTDRQQLQQLHRQTTTAATSQTDNNCSNITRQTAYKLFWHHHIYCQPVQPNNDCLL